MPNSEFLKQLEVGSTFCRWWSDLFGKLSVLSVLCYTAQCFINLSCRFPEVWRTSVIDRSVYLGCVSLGNSKIEFLEPKESKIGFCDGFFAKQINPRSLWSWCVKGTEEFTHHDQRDLGLICLAKKPSQNPILDSFGSKNSILEFLKKCTRN